jgi:hypothetical protein
MVSPSKNRCRGSSVYVVGVHGSRAVHVSGALGLEVLLDDGDHLVLLH